MERSVLKGGDTNWGLLAFARETHVRERERERERERKSVRALRQKESIKRRIKA